MEVEGGVLVTGANGFLGRNISTRLAQDWSVRGAVRSGDRQLVPGIERAIVGDLSARVDWSKALEGCATVVHTAAQVHVTGGAARDTDTFQAVNVDATARLAQQASAAGVRRFVLLSSVAVYGRNHCDGVIRENAPTAPVTEYGRSKLAAEVALSSEASGGSVEAVILRLPMVYGPGAPGNFLRFLGLVQRGVPLPFGAIENARSMLFVDNLSEAVAALLRTRAAPGRVEILHVADKEAVSTRALALELGGATGSRIRLLPVPATWLKLAGALLGRRDEVEKLLGSLRLDTTRFHANTGWRPSVDWREGVRISVRGNNG